MRLACAGAAHVDCETVEHMLLANALCRFVRAGQIGRPRWAIDRSSSLSVVLCGLRQALGGQLDEVARNAGIELLARLFL